VETALHRVVVRVENALDQQETALGVFLGIEGAFNNAYFESICDALVRHGGDYTIARWIRATLEGRDPQWFLQEDCGIQGVPRGGCVAAASEMPCCG
jgi:hypothetical protein